jgi:16S rRNA (cytidine1402-2'-O)-methyltransferase
MLYIVATPIGNFADITLRAIEILKTVDAVICEDTRQASTLLKKLDIPNKELIILDEHNEQQKTAELIVRLHSNQSMALISDAGTPVFADPGHYLISQAVDFGVPVSPIPGPSSLMAALSLLPFKLEQYMFGGFLPRDPDQRRKELFPSALAARASRSDGYPLPPGGSPGRCIQGVRQRAANHPGC